jgi:hypothetical protein
VVSVLKPHLSIFGLLLTPFGVAALYAFLGPISGDAMVIYVGGILVLLFRRHADAQAHDGPQDRDFQVIPALLLIAAVFGADPGDGENDLVQRRGAAARTDDGGDRKLFMREYILPLSASVFLLIALIGAAMIVRRGAE